MSGQVFISYSRTDRQYVDKLAAHLVNAQIPVWYDYAIDAGERFASVIQQQIDVCSAFVVVLTPASAASEWVNREISHAIDQRRPIMPILLAPCRTPILLAGLHQEDVTGGRMPPQRFVVHLRGLLPQPAPVAPGAGPAPAPRVETSGTGQIPRPPVAVAPRRAPVRWRIAVLALVLMPCIGGLFWSAPNVARWVQGDRLGVTPNGGSDPGSTNASTNASANGSEISERLVGQPKASNGGITITVTRVAEVPGAGARATRVEVTITNDTAAEIKVPLEFGACAFNDDDGTSLPASVFYTGSEWKDIVPAHAFRRAAVTFERTLPTKATMAELVLSFEPVSGVRVNSVVITVPGINLRSP